MKMVYKDHHLISISQRLRLLYGFMTNSESEDGMEQLGVIAAVLSSALGGTAVGASRYLTSSLDPITIGVIRMGGGCLVLIPFAIWRRERWPGRSDWWGVAGLGLLFFGIFPILFNASLIYTTAARGALALSTLPLLTMGAGALLRIEPLTLRKTVGVLIAMGGVAAALGSSLSAAPPGAWRGDLLMVGAALCMALYSVWSRPFISRSGPIPFTAAGMAVGAVALTLVAIAQDGLGKLLQLNTPEMLASLYLAVVCGAAIFFLWAYALGRASPTLVAVSVTVNPVTAACFGAAILGEGLDARLVVGLAAVLFGIIVAARIQPRWRSA